MGFKFTEEQKKKQELNGIKGKNSLHFTTKEIQEDVKRSFKEVNNSTIEECIKIKNDYEDQMTIDEFAEIQEESENNNEWNYECFPIL